MPPIHSRPRPQMQKPMLQRSQSGNKIALIVTISIAVILGIGVAAYFMYPPFADLFRSKPEQPFYEMPVEEPVQKPIVETIPVEELQPQKQESSNSVAKGFYIIVGSFQQKRNAEYFVKKCSKDTELQVLYFDEIGYYRVSAGKYDNIHKAYNDAYSIKDLDGCENAWVLENR